MKGALVLRLAVLAGLVVALLAGVPDDRVDSSGVVRLSPGWHRDGGAHDRVRRVLARGERGPLLVERAAGAPADEAELDALAALGRHATVHAARAEWTDIALRVIEPGTARAERAAAVGFELRGTPGDTVAVRIADGAGALDSTRVVLGADGRGVGGFRVRPSRQGWQQWRVEAGSASAHAGAWAHEPSPPRVLLVSGPPNWESRFVLRSLDESGVETRAVIPLGRGLHAGDAGASPLRGDDALAAFDAVIVMSGARLDAAQLDALRRFAARGGGVLAAGHDATWRAFGMASGEAANGRAVDAQRIRWRLPAELAPLPAVELRVTVAGVPAAAAPGITAAHADGVQLLSLWPWGYGRVAVLGIAETWRWRMEAGSVSEHREFWHALADWLAAGTDSPPLRVARTRGFVGRAVQIDVDAARVGASSSLVLERPDGSDETLPVRIDEHGSGSAAFVPSMPGEHRLLLDDGVVRAAFMAEAAPAADGDAAAQIALLAWASGGEVVDADSLAARREAWRAGVGIDGGPAPWLRWLLFGAILLAALAEWTLRRLRGFA